MKNYHYNVKPRYTCGSPAAVDEREALRQAEAEKCAYEYIIQGVEGVERQARAERLGLGPTREGQTVQCPNCYRMQDATLVACDWCHRTLAEAAKKLPRFSPAELVIEHSNHWMVKCLISGEIFTRPFAWVPVEKTTNCKRCRREHERNEHRKLLLKNAQEIRRKAALETDMLIRGDMLKTAQAYEWEAAQ